MLGVVGEPFAWRQPLRKVLLMIGPGTGTTADAGQRRSPPLVGHEFPLDNIHYLHSTSKTAHPSRWASGLVAEGIPLVIVRLGLERLGGGHRWIRGLIPTWLRRGQAHLLVDLLCMLDRLL
jgi:hypothetical protein